VLINSSADTHTGVICRFISKKSTVTAQSTAASKATEDAAPSSNPAPASASASASASIKRARDRSSTPKPSGSDSEAEQADVVVVSRKGLSSSGTPASTAARGVLRTSSGAVPKSAIKEGKDRPRAQVSRKEKSGTSGASKRRTRLALASESESDAGGDGNDGDGTGSVASSVIEIVSEAVKAAQGPGCELDVEWVTPLAPQTIKPLRHTEKAFSAPLSSGGLGKREVSVGTPKRESSTGTPKREASVGSAGTGTPKRERDLTAGAGLSAELEALAVSLPVSPDALVFDSRAAPASGLLKPAVFSSPSSGSAPQMVSDQSAPTSSQALVEDELRSLQHQLTRVIVHNNGMRKRLRVAVDQHPECRVEYALPRRNWEDDLVRQCRDTVAWQQLREALSENYRDVPYVGLSGAAASAVSSSAVAGLSSAGAGAGISSSGRDTSAASYKYREEMDAMEERALSDDQLVTACSVCFGTAVDEEELSRLVTCERCNISVHRRCYGVHPDVDSSVPWFCDYCIQHRSRKDTAGMIIVYSVMLWS